MSGTVHVALPDAPPWPACDWEPDPVALAVAGSDTVTVISWEEATRPGGHHFSCVDCHKVISGGDAHVPAPGAWSVRAPVHRGESTATATDTTIFGADASHYNPTIRNRNGLDLFTHKLTDGAHFYEDTAYAPSIIAARNLGVPVLGPYHVLHGGVPISAQADWLIARADALTPWWRTWPYWVWQADCEPFAYLVAPTIEEINAFGDAMVARTLCSAAAFLPYAPAWHYGSALSGLRYRTYWGSDYGGNAAGPYRQIYPGNADDCWFKATIPTVILQYGSRPTDIPGDANAIRSTLPAFQSLITDGAAMPITDADAATLWAHDIDPAKGSSYTAGGFVWVTGGRVLDLYSRQIPALAKAINQLATAQANDFATLTQTVQALAAQQASIVEALADLATAQTGQGQQVAAIAAQLVELTAAVNRLSVGGVDPALIVNPLNDHMTQIEQSLLLLRDRLAAAARAAAGELTPI